tara:strand:+ start:619 stop:888 length:270 start_codon:yes stop_codon:yes gene_type:complete
MKKIFIFLTLLQIGGLNPLYGQSNLLESVKKNPNNAIEMCKKFREFNSKGISANSDEALNYVSRKNKLNPINAEILSIYVIGLHCPNVI